MQNYINYFTEIEEHFQRRRGSLLLLSTLDWALIETWQEAGIPLEAVLRGIDDAFDKHDARQAKSRTRKVNGLAYCMQAVIAAAEAIVEASTGAARAERETGKAAGFEQERIAEHLRECAAQLEAAKLIDIAAKIAAEQAATLRSAADEIDAAAPDLEELERRLTMLEEKLLNAVIATTPETGLVALREESSRELAPYRSRMQSAQIKQIEQQFLHKRLFEKHKLPRLSLFYMRQA